MFLIISGVAFILVVIGQTLQAFKNRQQTTEFAITGQSAGSLYASACLDVIAMMVPTYDTFYTLMQTLVIFGLSIAFMKTRKYEDQEAMGRTYNSRRLVDSAENIEGMRNYQVQKAVQLIKDYQFKTYMAVYLEIVILALISSVGCTILITPYALIYLILCLILAFSGRSKLLITASQKMTLVFLALLMIDLPAKYLIKGGHFITDNSSQRYFNQIVGLLSSLPTYIEFYLKIALFLIECQKLQYSQDYQTLFDQIKAAHVEKSETLRLFRKRTSFAFRIFKPISIFMFSFLAILFSLIHPSMIFLFMLPLFIFGFFLTQNQYRGLSKFIVLIFCLYVLTSFVFHVTFLILPNDQYKEDIVSQVEKILGVKRDSELPTKMFPNQLDFVFCFVLSFFTNYIAKKDKTLQRSQGQDSRLQSLYRAGFEDDILTIPDDISEVRSRISYKPGSSIKLPQGVFSDKTGVLQTSRIRNMEPSEIIMEDKKEEDEHDDIVVESKEISVIHTDRSSRHKNYRQKNIWSLSRDETLRGKIRRLVFKMYLKAKQYFDNLLDLLIIHCSKVALLAIFVIAASKPNFFNATLFILFLTLAMISYKNIKKYWKLPIIFDSVILLSMYSLDVFIPKDLQNLDSITLHFIGITLPKGQDSSLALGKYGSYLLLLVILVITHYVIHSKRYEEFIQINYEQKQQNDQDEDETELLFTEGKEEQNNNNNNQIGASDPFTRFSIKSAIYLLVIALFIECSLLPISILNFILLSLMVSVVVKYMNSANQIQMYEKLHTTLKIIKWTSLVFLFFKYMFQFQDFAENLASKSNEDMRKYYEHLPIIEKLLGIENSYMPIKLFSLALVMVISNFQLKFLSHTNLIETLRQQDKQFNEKLYFLAQENQTKFKKIMHFLSVYITFALYHILLPLPIIFIIRYSLNYISIIGLLMLSTAVLVMFFERQNFWRLQYRLIGITVSLIMLIIYGLQFLFMHFSDQSDIEFFKWIGVYKQNQETQVIYEQLIPLFSILIVCALQKQSQAWIEKFQITVTGKEIKKIQDQISKSISNDQQDDELNTLSKLQAVYEYEAPIRHCLKFRDVYISILLYLNGPILIISFALLVILYKLNIVSLILSIFLMKIMSARYYPMRFTESQQMKDSKNKLYQAVKNLTIITSLLVIFQYFMIIGPAFKFDFTSWKDFITSKLCIQASKQCQQDWGYWLSLTNIPSSYIVLDFGLLLLCYLNLFFTGGYITIKDSQLSKQPRLNDKNDFLSSSYQGNKIMASLNYLLFSGFPFVFISYLLIFAASFHGSGMADLMSAAYLFLSFYFIVNFRKLYTKNSFAISFMRSYNFVILVALIIYQAPFFICPSADSYSPYTGFLYIGTQKCAEILKDSVDEQKFTNTNSYLAVYIVFSQSLGLIKINQVMLDFIVLVMIVEIQCMLFNHPYFQVYVLQHMTEEKETDGKLRAFMFVEKSHLNILWSYKAIKEEIKILHSRLLRINQNLRNQEHSSHLFMEEDNDQNEKIYLMTDERNDSDKHSSADSLGFNETQTLLQIGEDNPERQVLMGIIDSMVEEYSIEIENMALDLLTRPDTPVVPLKLFMTTFRNYLLQNDQLKENLLSNSEHSRQERQQIIEEALIDIVKKLQRQVHHKQRIDLYYKEGIGLNFAIQNGSDVYLKEGDYQFYNHLILQNQMIVQDEDKEDFEVKESYEELFLIYDQFKEVEKKDSSFFKKLNLYIRSYLWTRFINKQLFYSLTQKNQESVPLQKMPFMRLLSNCILSQSQNLCYFVLFLNFIINPNLISLVLPLSSLLYALIDYPVPSIRYWKYLMAYMLVTVALKFLYQLPIFCGSPAYSLFSVDGCSTTPVMPEVLLKRIDYIIGIHKFAGPSSYPKDQGILLGILGDIMVLLTLMILKNYLIKIGHWHYVRTKNNIYQSPAFKCKAEELTQNERLVIIGKDNFKIYEYEQSNLFGKLWIKISHFFSLFSKFVMKLMPFYMDTYQKNLDLRTQNELNFIVHNPKKAKPGRDFFSANFFALLLIFIYNLFWFRNVTGETQTVGISSANLQRFSTAQVGLLFFILLLMMGERMLFRVRYFDSSSNSVSSGVLGKHQLTIKIVIHIITIVFVHVYLGFIVPRHNLLTIQRKFPLIFCYLLWVYYFVSSALQIRYGYPQAPFKPPFTRDTSFFKVWAFRIYKALPFLWEMKVIIDWTVTATSLDLYQWFKIDDAFNYLYQNHLQNNDRASRPQYAPRAWYEKFFQGFCFAFGLILVILAPILLFSGINPIMVKNPVLSGQLQMYFELNSNGNSYSILQSQAFHIQSLEHKDINSLSNLYVPVNVQFAAQDMQKMHFSPYSEAEWSISPPSLQKFIDDFNFVKDEPHAFVDIHSVWNFKRNNPIGNEGTQAETKTRLSLTKLQPIIDLLSNKPSQNSTIGTSQNATDNKGSILVDNIFPKILKLGSTQQAALLEVQQISDAPVMSSAELTLNRVNGHEMYWTYSLSENDKQGVFKESQSSKTLQGQNEQPEQNMILVVYNEEVIGSFFGSAFQLSVVGLYATIVIAIGRFLRLIFDRISQRVIYEEMNDTEQLFEICEGIFIAQLEGDLVKEKRLYDLLIRMYRSPETLIKMTGARLQYKDGAYNQNQLTKEKLQLEKSQKLLLS